VSEQREQETKKSYEGGNFITPAVFNDVPISKRTAFILAE
jgi:hypothetical protein